MTKIIIDTHHDDILKSMIMKAAEESFGYTSKFSNYNLYLSRYLSFTSDMRIYSWNSENGDVPYTHHSFRGNVVFDGYTEMENILIFFRKSILKLDGDNVIIEANGNLRVGQRTFGKDELMAVINAYIKRNEA